jgi:hypothetical protein
VETRLGGFEPSIRRRRMTAFETARKMLFAGSLVLVRQFVRHESGVFVFSGHNESDQAALRV